MPLPKLEDIPNPYLPEAPEDGKHRFQSSQDQPISYRCYNCGAYNRSDTPEFNSPCRGLYKESGKMKAWAEDKWLEAVKKLSEKMIEEGYS